MEDLLYIYIYFFDCLLFTTHINTHYVLLAVHYTHISTPYVLLAVHCTYQYTLCIVAIVDCTQVHHVVQNISHTIVDIVDFTSRTDSIAQNTTADILKDSNDPLWAW